MAHDDVDLFFTKYVSWMCRDIEREIEWERQNKDAGNLLCALGLLVYTEVLGRVRRWNDDRPNFYVNRREQPKLNFIAAFDRFDGGSYGVWRLAWEARHHRETSIYEVVRSGMVHEYRPKAPSWIHFGHGRDCGLVEEVEGGAPVLKFFIVPYLRHFAAEAAELRQELANRPFSTLPPAHLREQNAIYIGPVVTHDIAGSASSSVISGSSVASGADLHSLTREQREKLFRRE